MGKVLMITMPIAIALVIAALVLIVGGEQKHNDLVKNKISESDPAYKKATDQEKVGIALLFIGVGLTAISLFFLKF